MLSCGKGPGVDVVPEVADSEPELAHGALVASGGTERFVGIPPVAPDIELAWAHGAIMPSFGRGREMDIPPEELGIIPGWV